MNKISPEKFVWEKYCGYLGLSISQLLKVNDPYGKGYKLHNDVTPIGYCEANRIRIRNRTEGYVIMVEIDGEETWFHLLELPV